MNAIGLHREWKIERWLLCAAILLCVPRVPAEAVVQPEWGSSKVFFEDFESGTKYWKTTGAGIRTFRDAMFGKCMRIARPHRRGTSFITKTFTGYTGTLIFKAKIKSEDITPGARIYQLGKFQAVVESAGEEKAYISDDFKGTSDWVERIFEVQDLKSTDVVTLRIGLEFAKGIMYVDEISVVNSSD